MANKLTKKYFKNKKKKNIKNTKGNKSLKRGGGMPYPYQDIKVLSKIKPFNPIPIIQFNYTKDQFKKLKTSTINPNIPPPGRPSILTKMPGNKPSCVSPSNGWCKDNLLAYYSKTNSGRYRGTYPFSLQKGCEDTEIYDKYIDNNKLKDNLASNKDVHQFLKFSYPD